MLFISRKWDWDAFLVLGEMAEDGRMVNEMRWWKVFGVKEDSDSL